MQSGGMVLRRRTLKNPSSNLVVVGRKRGLKAAPSAAAAAPKKKARQSIAAASSVVPETAEPLTKQETISSGTQETQETTDKEDEKDLKEETYKPKGELKEEELDVSVSKYKDDSVKKVIGSHKTTKRREGAETKSQETELKKEEEEAILWSPAQASSPPLQVEETSCSTLTARDELKPLVNGSGRKDEVDGDVKEVSSLLPHPLAQEPFESISAACQDNQEDDLEETVEESIPASLASAYEPITEVEDVILKEFEESQREAAAAVATSLSSQPTPIPIQPPSPIKRTLRSKTKAAVPKKEPVKPNSLVARKKANKKNAKGGGKNASKAAAAALEAESNAASDHSTEEPLVPLKGAKALLVANEALVKEEILARLRSFQHIKENVFLCERRSNKQSRGMECDCSLSKEEIASNKKGCGENCLNRLLKIECSKLCSLGKLCGNNKFQSSDNAPVEVFKTDCKGFGVRATSSIPDDTFIMEYVGEVLDAKQFRKRAKQYAKDDVRHFYFMALSTEFCIDAGSKGNISRFINHSCSPNSETQKWMVDGQMRIGFFTKRRVSVGEEITFDYKYERYGQEAQKCYCAAENCRGWLGGEPSNSEDEEEENEDNLEEDDYWSTSEEEEEVEKEIQRPQDDKSATKPEEATPLLGSPPIPAPPLLEITPPEEESDKKTKKVITEEEKEAEKDKDYIGSPILPEEQEVTPFSGEEVPTQPKKRRRRRRSPRKIKNYEEIQDEDEIDRLKSSGIRTKNHTVELSRIMVRTTDTTSRSILAGLLLAADTPCKRLFLDYYGLKILYGWMSENAWENLSELGLKIQILNILSALGIPHKTMLVDCKIWDLISNWAIGKLREEDQPESPPPGQQPDEPNICDEAHRTEESSQSEEVLKTLREQPVLKEEVFEADIQPISKVLPQEEEKESDKSSEEIDERCRVISLKSKELIESWANLKEVFKIPKKDRIALRAEHEREADQAAALHAPPKPRPSSTPNGPPSSASGILPTGANAVPVKTNYFPPAPVPLVSKRVCSRWDDRSGRLHLSKLSREERRELFALRVQTQEDEKKRRELLLEHHRNKCFYLNLPAEKTPLFPHYPSFVFNPEDGNWYQMPEPYPKVIVSWGYADMATDLPPEAYREGDEPLPDRGLLYPPGIVPVSYLYGIPLTTPEDYYRQQQAILQQTQAPQTLQRPDEPPALEDPPSYSPTPFHILHAREEPPPPPPLPQEPPSVSPELPPMPNAAPPEAASGLKAATSKDNVTIVLPPPWRAALSSAGQLYFYNSSNKAVQWDPPPNTSDEDWVASSSATPLEVEVETLSTDSEDANNDDEEDEDEASEDEENEEDGGGGGESSLSEREKEIILLRGRVKKKTKEERQHERRQKRERDREKREYERKRRRERHGQHRRDGLVQELFIPGRTESEKREVMANRELKEKLFQQSREKLLAQENSSSHQLSSSSTPEKKASSGGGEGASSSTPQTSSSSNPLSLDSEKEKKHKDRFLKEASKVIVKVLDPYRRSDVPCGQIKSVEDFKHLARKLTNFVMTKELKHCTKIEDLKCSESVKKKAAEFVKKYMSKFGDVYKRSPSS